MENRWGMTKKVMIKNRPFRSQKTRKTPNLWQTTCRRSSKSFPPKVEKLIKIIQKVMFQIRIQLLRRWSQSLPSKIVLKNKTMRESTRKCHNAKTSLIKIISTFLQKKICLPEIYQLLQTNRGNLVTMEIFQWFFLVEITPTTTLMSNFLTIIFNW